VKEEQTITDNMYIEKLAGAISRKIKQGGKAKKE